MCAGIKNVAVLQIKFLCFGLLVRLLKHEGRGNVRIWLVGIPRYLGYTQNLVLAICKIIKSTSTVFFVFGLLLLTMVSYHVDKNLIGTGQHYL